MGAAGKTVRRFWTEHEDTKHGNQTNFLARKAMMQQHITHDNVLGNTWWSCSSWNSGSVPWITSNSIANEMLILHFHHVSIHMVPISLRHCAHSIAIESLGFLPTSNNRGYTCTSYCRERPFFATGQVWLGVASSVSVVLLMLLPFCLDRPWAGHGQIKKQYWGKAPSLLETNNKIGIFECKSTHTNQITPLLFSSLCNDYFAMACSHTWNVLWQHVWGLAYANCKSCQEDSS